MCDIDSKLNILWITLKPILQRNGTLISEMASTRYRVIIPSGVLGGQNYQHTFFATPDKFNLDEIKSIVDSQDVVIFSKTFSSVNEEIANYAKQRKIKIIFDICDNRFILPEFSQNYKNMVDLSDKVVVNTDLMAEIVKQYTGRDSSVIQDPYEFQRCKPNFKPRSDTLNLLWFGHHSNIDALKAMIPTLAPLSKQIRLKLHIVTSANIGMEQACKQFNKQSSNFKLFFSEWSVAATQKAMQQADMVLIPSFSNTIKSVKSPNRVIESLWSGRFVVADPLPSYKEFAQFAWIDEDLLGGIIWGLQNPNKVIHNIRESQGYIEQNFSPEKIGAMWKDLLE
jgi:glycosyltransferase involved in cell wall biosynthesis